MRTAVTVVVAAIVGSFAGLSGPAHAVPVVERELDWVLKRTPDVARGAKLYDTCAACHGKDGQGVSDGTVPAIGGQHFTVLAKQLVDFRTGWRADPRMRHFSDVQFLAFSQDIADVATYISQLPPPPAKSGSDAKESERGAMLYTRSCARCHGVEAEGNADQLAPRLASQHAAYLIRQLEEASAGYRQPMQETHTAARAKMTASDTAAVAQFLAGLRATTP